MSTVVLYDNANEYTTRAVSFTNNSSPADPTTVSAVVTDPGGNSTTYTYPASSNLVKVSTGNYTLKIQCSPATAGTYGLWTVVWIGATSGTLDENIQTDTFRTMPLSDAITGAQNFYCGKEELKARLNGTGIMDNLNDYEVVLAIQTVTDWVTAYCGQHFYQVTEARTFVPYNIYDIRIDPAVSVSSVDLDLDGDGVFETHWTTANYQLLRSEGRYNVNARGIPLPYTKLQVIGAGIAGPVQFLPFTWPFTPNNRVEVTGTWGWQVVPPGVVQASLLLAVDLFRLKDAAWGIAGTNEFGTVRVQSNPMVVELLRPYIRMSVKAGVLCSSSYEAGSAR